MRYVTSIERLATERGMQQGMQQGLQQGLQQGEHLGEANALARLITKRFGSPSAETQGRLKAATPEQLEQWLENILDAATLEDVFKNH